MDVQSVYPQVAKIIADVLSIDVSEITLSKSFVFDLGAESIDFLDLMFQLEQEFGIKIPRGQLEKQIRWSLKDIPFEKNGIITPEGLQALKIHLSEVPESRFKSNLKVSEIPTLFTVETYCKLVIQLKLEAAQSEIANL